MWLYDVLVNKFHEGGLFVMSSIAFVLFLTLVIVLERAIRYWISYDLSNTEAFMSAIQKLVLSNSIENAIRLCKKADPKLVATVLGEGLKRANDSIEEIERSMESATLGAIPKVVRWIPLLGTVANIATLLGLLGTIFGLIRSFGGAAGAVGADKQKILASGISEALTATSFGLSTALFCILAHGILSLKKDAIVSDIHESSAKLVDMLYTRKVKIDGEASVKR